MTLKSKESTVPVQAESRPAANGFSLISNEKLLQLYATMLKCRMIEERIRVLSEETNFNGNGFCSLGHEAAIVGTAIDLLHDDTIADSHSDLMTSFVLGAPLSRIMSSLHARIKGSAADHLETVTAAAMAHKTKRNKKIAVAFSNGASNQLDSWDAALNLANNRELPILFVCRNGLHDVLASPAAKGKLSKGSAGETGGEAGRHTFPSITVDGNDVVAVYRVASESISRARNGRGPTLIECQRWQTDDPILNMEQYLTGKGLFTGALKRQIAGGFSRELDSAVEAVDK